MEQHADTPIPCGTSHQSLNPEGDLTQRVLVELDDDLGALATEVEQELNAVLEATTRISDMNTSVASATEEQTQVVDDMNRSITDINDLAFASAARSEEINATSHALDGYARELEKQTAKSRV
jgi:methyl-accepting chemotaxis protein